MTNVIYFSGNSAPGKSSPVQLQINNSGSWKTIARFDAHDEAAADKAVRAGQLLGELGPRSTLRIATDDPLPCVMARWDCNNGWQAATR